MRTTVRKAGGLGRNGAIFAAMMAGACGMASTAMGQCAMSFAAPSYLNQGAAAGNARRMAMADINGDGFPDVVSIANQYGAAQSAVTVMLGNGAGGFSAPIVTAVGTSIAGVAVADLNRDGHQDLVLGDLSDTGHVLLGNGDGTFQAPIPLDATTGLGDIALGDFNGDGIPDVAAGLDHSTQLRVALGNGDGTFAFYTTYYPGWDPEHTLVADVNSDGKLDLVVSLTGSSYIAVMLGGGNGTFASPIITDLAILAYPAATAAADFNGDGKSDLVTANYYSHNVSVLLGNGNGTFRSPVHYAAGAAAEPSHVAVADVNGDGRPDVLIADWGAGLRMFLGNGDGTLQPVVTLPATASPCWIVPADINGDGKPDIVTPSGWANVAFLMNTGPQPAFMLQPHDTSAAPGASVQISSAAPGAASYRWRRAGVELSNGGNISGADTTTLTINPVGAADAGLYDVRVTNACGFTLSRAARLTVQSCYANCDASTTAPVLNVLDFVCFLNRFAAADPYANCDGSTVPPVLNVNDFVCFLNGFAAGCSS